MSIGEKAVRSMRQGGREAWRRGMIERVRGVEKKNVKGRERGR